MKINNKKGAWSALMKLIIAFISIFTIILVLGVFFPIFGQESEIQTCRNWLALHALKKGATLGFIGIEPFFGYGNSKESGNLYTDNSPCKTTIEKIKQKDTKEDNGVYKKIADNMFTCWRKYGEGKIDFYSDIDFSIEGIGKNSYCRVCSDIILDKNVKPQKINLDDFEIFLSNEISPNNKDTYAEFFLEEDNTQIDFGQGELTLDKDNHLYSIFSITKESEDIKSTAPIAGGSCLVGIKLGSIFGIPGAIAGCGIGIISTVGLTYRSDKIPAILLYQNNPENLKKACDSVIINPKNEKDFKTFLIKEENNEVS